MELVIEREETRDMRLTAFSSKVFWMSLTKNRGLFDGVLQDASVTITAEGHIFGSDRFEDGSPITTSEVVKVGHVLGIGPYVETRTGSRYLISSVDTDSGWDEAGWFERKQKHISVNENYFRPLQWSL